MTAELDRQIAEGRYESAKAELMAGIRLIPDHLQDGLIHHCLDGRETGGFLTACLENDLMEAINRMNPGTAQDLKNIMQFLYNYSPPGCWGDRRKVAEWRVNGGLRRSQ